MITALLARPLKHKAQNMSHIEMSAAGIWGTETEYGGYLFHAQILFSHHWHIR